MLSMDPTYGEPSNLAVNNHQAQHFFAPAKKVGRKVCNFGVTITVGAISVIGGVSAALVCLVALPIIGTAGSLGFLLSAGYHKAAESSQKRQTCRKDENGKFIKGTELINQSNAHYQPLDGFYKINDLPRLKHEKQRLYHQKISKSSLKGAKELAKLIIPVIGPLWVFCTQKPPEQKARTNTSERKLDSLIARLAKLEEPSKV